MQVLPRLWIFTLIPVTPILFQVYLPTSSLFTSGFDLIVPPECIIQPLKQRSKVRHNYQIYPSGTCC